MDTTNYIKLLEERNRHRNRIIELPKPEYTTVYGEKIKGIMFRDKFYSASEYEGIKKENRFFHNTFFYSPHV